MSLKVGFCRLYDPPALIGRASDAVHIIFAIAVAARGDAARGWHLDVHTGFKGASIKYSYDF